jgi:hypothetical protein
MTFVVLSLAADYGKFRQDTGVRKVNKSDLRAYFRHLNNILTDLFSAWMADPKLYIGYSRGKANYRRGGCYWDFKNDRALLSNTIYLNLIDFLAERGYIENHIANSGRNRYSSRMRAKPKLIERLQAEKVNWASILTDPSASAIVVKDENKNVIAPPADDDFDLEQAEANLRRINENLQTTFINLDIKDEEYEALGRRIRQSVDDEHDPDDLDGQREPLDFTNRSLRRIFAQGSYDCGGRFYGGWWQEVPSKYRKFIEIDGCMTREMDFSTIQPRILYAEADAEPPEDAYAVPGWDADLRPIIKKAFNQLVNSSEGSRNENQWHRFAPGIEPDPLPESWAEMKTHQKAVVQREEFQKRTGRQYEELLRDLKAMHEPIDRFFFSQAWTWLQRRDADIAEKVMLKLLDQLFTALPIHDSFIVRRGAEYALETAMNEAFEEVVGTKSKVDRDEAVYDPPPGYGEEVRSRIVSAADYFDETKRHILECTKYHGREVDWTRVWGTID